MAYPNRSGPSVKPLAEGQKTLSENQAKIIDNLKTLTKGQTMIISLISKQGDRMDRRFEAMDQRFDKLEKQRRWPWSR